MNNDTLGVMQDEQKDGLSCAFTKEELTQLTDDIIAALKTVYDPEVPVDIYELGLIYRVEVTDERDVLLDMTLTSPMCPVAEQLPQMVEEAVSLVPGIRGVKVQMVFDPPWDSSKMSDEAKLSLNMWDR